MNTLKTVDPRKLALLLSGLCLGTLAVWHLLPLHPPPPTPESHPMDPTAPATFHYETVPGLFAQDDPATTRPPTTPGPTTSAWPVVLGALRALPPSPGGDEPRGRPVPLVLRRAHGQGVHNVAEDFYGTQAWDAYWSRLEGNGTVVWADAHLTGLGEAQAREAGGFLGAQFEGAGMPRPGRFYVSPLFRCLQTARLTWAGLGEGFEPVVKEGLREVMGVHTCDRRSRRSFLAREFAGWRFEEGFTEVDELWVADRRETGEEIDGRTRRALDEIFGGEEEEEEGVVVVSTTTHSGQIASLLRVVGHRVFGLPTGGMMPVLVKGTRVG
ncbi:PMU1-high copy suppressor of ts tps2 mutant phenotype [Teratosphaeria destructans]|uniref:PMU1-high copy suppressor of ts tps2 mutant phenotype n=1 Tax=Teratosphaeria destructans TaxID=418781 RepID=A0A9W7SX67_9PEZI|nr:PMU1-high copy suppressor of ts tps2 mutant phenotype [Teratosphaeria destructans]